MFLTIKKAYKDYGIDLHIGNNKVLCASMAKDGKMMHAGGGISVTDVAFFFGLSKIFIPEKIFCIGNASGYGGFVLAEIFDKAQIDVIDAEIEGEFNSFGSEITRKISEKYFGNRITLTSGFSPQDLSKATKDNKYDLVFIDGAHTNEQQSKDFFGILPYLNDKCVIYLHDVDMCGMMQSFNDIKNQSQSLGFSGFNIDFTTFGCKALVKSLPDVQQWFEFLDQSPVDDWKYPQATLHFNK